MLVLARRVNESIMIGDQVEVIVVSVQGDQVKLGIRAPRSIAVHRKEIYEEIQRENLRAAAQSSPDSAKKVADLLKGRVPGPGKPPGGRGAPGGGET